MTARERATPDPIPRVSRCSIRVSSPASFLTSLFLQIPSVLQRGITLPELTTIYDYMRTHANLLGERILQKYPALHRFHDPVSPRIEGLLRRPFPAQTIAIMGLAKGWLQERTGMVVAECGTGKILISLGAAHVHSKGSPFIALAPWYLRTWSKSGRAKRSSLCLESEYF